MSGYPRILKKSSFIVGLGLLCLPSFLFAQTVAERARAEERVRALERARVEELARAKMLQERMEERLQFAGQEKLQRIAEAEFRVQEELARAQAMHEARAQAMHELGQERAEVMESRMRAVREAQRHAELQAREDFQRVRQEVQRAQQVMLQVKSRVRLGVSLDGNQGQEFDVLGARLEGTMEESPAEEAGLREGDIITHMNGQSLLAPLPEGAEEDLDEDESLPVQRLMALAQDLEAGENVEIRYLRDGSPQTVSFQTADVDAPSIAIFRSGEGDEPTLRIMRSPGEESVYRVRPGRGGVWSFEGPDKELQELHISRIKDLQELGELKELAELEDLQVHLKDLQLDLQDMDEMERNIIIRGGPGSEAGRWTVRAGEGPAGLYAFRGSSAGFGLKLTEMNPGLSEYFTSDAGLLVLEIDEDSSLGLLAGDVILAIDGRTVSTQRDVDRILGSYEEDEAVSFTVVRKGREIRVEGKAG